MPPDSPEGLCPRCLIAMNLATQTEIPGETGPAKQPPAPPLPVADVAKLFPQLEILECLGRGGMGAVYKARQPRLDRLVALKILSPEKQGNQKFAERFEREARALARLHHPNIVAVFDFGEVQGNFYLLMEFVDGLTLRQVLEGRRLSPGEALVIVPKICEALQYAHEQGIVHRDIKPENILMDKAGHVKIADFGIAKILGDGERTNLTEEQAIGTPHYMSPEQIEKPQSVDHRADIYSLGVVFYEMLTGELPLGKFQPPSRKVHIDVRLDEIVLRALEKEPERRFQHVSEVKTQVETVAATPGKTSGDGTQIENQSHTELIAANKKSPLSWAAILIGIVILAAVVFIFAYHRTDVSNGVTLTESDFLQKFESNQIEQATVTANGSVTTINGKFLETDKSGKANEVPFVVPNVVMTSAIEDKILPSNKVKINIPNPMLSDIGYQLLFFLFPIGVLVVLGVGVLMVWRGSKNKSGPRGSEKPDHFWRRFAIVVLLLISIPFVMAILGLLAAIAIPAFVQGRQHALALRQQQAAAMPFHVGQTWFPQGDSIEITSVEQTEDQMTVKGHYNLVSHDTASLAFYITSTNSTGFSEGEKQAVKISKGSGDFELIHPHLVVGLPHVSMYANGHSFAAIYFGDEQQAEEESKAEWITNSGPALAAGFNAIWVNNAALLAVECRGANHDVVRWSPDGKPLPAVVQSALSDYTFPEKNGGAPDYIFTILLRNSQDSGFWKYAEGGCGADSFNPFEDPYVKYSSIETNKTLGGVIVRLATTFNTQKKSTTVIYGLPWRQPKDFLNWDGPALQLQVQPDWPKSVPPPHLTVGPSTNSPYLSAVTVSNLPEYFDGDWHLFLTATDRDGREHQSTYSVFAGGRATRIWMLDVAPGNIASIRLQGGVNGEYTWSEFNNIRLKPNSESDGQSTDAEPADLREARAKLAELRASNGEQTPAVQEVLASIKELERMSSEETNASLELREAKAHLAELRVLFGEQNPDIQQALARVKALETNSAEPSDSNPTVDEQPPVVVETFPASGARDVEPGETEIHVRFSKEMMDGSWSWSSAGENSTPEFIGSPHYDTDSRTCIAKVKLEPGRSYAFWLNSDNFHNFRDKDGQSAVPYLLTFQTKPN